jgi:peptide/nickel transport system substrate-binding protein
VKMRSYEWGTFFSDIRKGNFQIYTLTWVGITDPDIYYYLFHSKSLPPNGANRGTYLNPEMDLLIERGRVLQGREERKEVYGRIQKILARDLPYVSLWNEVNVVVMDPRVRGFVLRMPSEKPWAWTDRYPSSTGPFCGGSAEGTWGSPFSSEDP